MARTRIKKLMYRYPAMPPLTSRQTEVVALVAEGFTDQQIADRLYVNPSTAYEHFRRAALSIGLDTEMNRRVLLTRWWIERNGL